MMEMTDRDINLINKKILIIKNSRGGLKVIDG